MTTLLILAPHVDDELIGCYSYLNDFRYTEKVVRYFYDLDEERLKEAEASSQKLGFRILKGDCELDYASFDEVLVPSRKDWHPHHRAVNAEYRKYATKFYSVDMVDAYVLEPKHQQNKLRLLNTYYPSQKKLWERDDKYWLFESVHSRDYDVYLREIYPWGSVKYNELDSGEYPDLSGLTSLDDIVNSLSVLKNKVFIYFCGKEIVL